MDAPTALIVAASNSSQLDAYLDRPEVVIAADAGLAAVVGRGWTPDRLVGDLDSADPVQVADLERRGIPIDRFPADKDETDLELALAIAVSMGVSSVEVVVRDDGRLDHQLANLMVLAHPRWQEVAISARLGGHRAWVIHRHLRPDVPVGAHLGLFAVGGEAEVSARGVAYPLDRFVLSPFVGRGVANQVTEPTVEVLVSAGVVLAVSSPT